MCHKCGKEGHNSRTCGILQEPSPPLVGKRRKCSNCGREGHNSATCKGIGVKKCSYCGKLGHNVRTCKSNWWDKK